MPRKRKPNVSSGRAWTSLLLGALILGVPAALALLPAYADFTYSNYALGAAIILLGATSVWASKNSMVTLAWLEGINGALGVWTIISPFVLGTTTIALYLNVLLGVLLVVVAVGDAYVAMTKTGGSSARRGRIV